MSADMHGEEVTATEREIVADAIERGIRQQESGWDACETCLGRVADVVLAALGAETAPPSERACGEPGCARAAEFYWHDAGPFGAGTFYGCADHAPVVGQPVRFVPPGQHAEAASRSSQGPTPALGDVQQQRGDALVSISGLHRKDGTEAPGSTPTRVARAEQTGHSHPGHTFGPGFAAWRFLKNLATKLRRPVIERREGAGWCMTDPTPPPDREVPVPYGYKPVCPLCCADPCHCAPSWRESTPAEKIRRASSG